MAAASQDDRFLKYLKSRFRGLQSVVNIQDLLLEYPFRLIALLGKWTESLREPVVQPRQNGNPLSRDRF
jgi:hypothetical protein